MLVNGMNIALMENPHRTADLQPTLSFHVFTGTPEAPHLGGNSFALNTKKTSPKGTHSLSKPDRAEKDDHTRNTIEFILITLAADRLNRVLNWVLVASLIQRLVGESPSSLERRVAPSRFGR
jgi:hypothetical protein